MLKVKKLDPNATVPTCAHPGEDLAFDLYALENQTIIAGRPNKIRTGIAAYFDNRAVPIAGTSGLVDYGLLIRDRSSMASKGMFVVGGVVDAGYRGEIIVVLNSTCTYDLKAGDKVAQMIPIPVYTNIGVIVVDELPEASRGDAGFGSTGK